MHFSPASCAQVCIFPNCDCITILPYFTDLEIEKTPLDKNPLAKPPSGVIYDRGINHLFTKCLKLSNTSDNWERLHRSPRLDPIVFSRRRNAPQNQITWELGHHILKVGDYFQWVGIGLEDGVEYAMFSIELWLEQGKVEGYVRNDEMRVGCQPVTGVWLAMMFAEWEGQIQGAIRRDRKYWDFIEFMQCES
jgi:hypothetical protein